MRKQRRVHGIRGWAAASAGLMAAVMLGGAGGPVLADAKYQIKVGVSTPPSYSYNIGLAAFKKQVEAGSNGEISVTIFPSAQLGGEVEMGKNVQLGTLESTVISASNLSPFHQPLQALSVPYLFKSLDCSFQVVDGAIGAEFTDAVLQKAKIRTLAWYTFGMRELFNSKRDVVKVADLKGLKIRVPADKLLELTWRTLGANPTPLPFPEVFNALQQGVIDGDANPVASIQQFKWYEVVKHVSLAKVAVGLSPFIIGERFYGKLPAAYQELVSKAALASAKVNREAHAKSTESAMAFLRGQGVKFTEPDLDDFRANVKPVWDEAKKTLGADLIDRILAAQSSC
jgi:tripartite ATP-independent transporter DctP family solute receptor